MKAALVITTVCLGLFFSAMAFAACCGASEQQSACEGGSCQSTSYCDPMLGPCQCTDPNCGKNDCLSRSECCEAFGNVGAR